MPKNKDGYYRATFVTGKTPEGKPQRVTVRAKTKRELDEKMAEQKRLYARGVSLKDVSVSEWADTWLRVYKANATEGQKEKYRINVVHHILPALGSFPVKDVRASHLQAFLNGFTGGRKGTVQKIRITLRQLFDDAELEGIIDRNPARRLELPKLIEEKRRPLTEMERGAVCEVAKTHPQGCFALTLMYCGLRRGEALALLASDIDIGSRKINIDKSLLFSKGNQGYIKHTTDNEPGTKSWGGIRVVPMPDILMPDLEKQAQGKALEDVLFPKADGKHATETTVTNWWHSLMRQFHIQSGARLYRNKVLLDTSNFDDNVTPHFLRHTYATDLYAAGVDDAAIKSFMGHSSNDVTDRYRKMNDATFYRTLDLINQYHASCADNVPNLAEDSG